MVNGSGLFYCMAVLSYMFAVAAFYGRGLLLFTFRLLIVSYLLVRGWRSGSLTGWLSMLIP